MQFTFRVIDHGTTAATWVAAVELVRAETAAGHRVHVNQNFGRWDRLAAIVVEVEQREDVGPLAGIKVA